MKIALHDAGGKEYLQFMRQLGVEYVVSAVGPGASGALEVDDIVRKKEYFAEHGVIWDVIENLDPRIYYKVMLGEEGREEQMDRVCESIRAVGEAGIGVLQYQWMLLGGLRTEYSPTGRGGARVPRFDMAVAARMPAAAMDWLGGGVYPTVPDRELSASQVWDNFRYFLARAVPVAEECGVKLAAHPDDGQQADPAQPSYRLLRLHRRRDRGVRRQRHGHSGLDHARHHRLCRRHRRRFRHWPRHRTPVRCRGRQGLRRRY